MGMLMSGNGVQGTSQAVDEAEDAISAAEHELEAYLGRVAGQLGGKGKASYVALHKDSHVLEVPQVRVKLSYKSGFQGRSAGAWEAAGDQMKGVLCGPAIGSESPRCAFDSSGSGPGGLGKGAAAWGGAGGTARVSNLALQEDSHALKEPQVGRRVLHGPSGSAAGGRASHCRQQCLWSRLGLRLL